MKQINDKIINIQKRIEDLKLLNYHNQMEYLKLQNEQLNKEICYFKT